MNMNIRQLLKDEDFLRKDQFERREILKNYILTDKNCRIGIKVVCFEKEVISNSRYFYNKSKNHKQVNTTTLGETYEILDHKRGQIKIENDGGIIRWYAIARFLFLLQYERLEKLKKLQNIKGYE